MLFPGPTAPESVTENQRRQSHVWFQYRSNGKTVFTITVSPRPSATIAARPLPWTPRVATLSLIWLYDNRGGYALLMIDAETGEADEFPMPYPPGGDGPFAAILSSRNRYYTHFNSHFVEFDPEKRAFTFFHKTVPADGP